MERDLGSLVVGDDGRTAVKGGAAVLREELFRAKRDSDRAVGAQALLEWIDAWPGDQPAAPVPVEAVGAGVAFPAGFPGWRQSAAPGALLPPLPLNFELPVGPAPVLAVAPW